MDIFKSRCTYTCFFFSSINICYMKTKFKQELVCGDFNLMAHKWSFYKNSQQSATPSSKRSSLAFPAGWRVATVLGSMSPSYPFCVRAIDGELVLFTLKAHSSWFGQLTHLVKKHCTHRVQCSSYHGHQQGNWVHWGRKQPGAGPSHSSQSPLSSGSRGRGKAAQRAQGSIFRHCPAPGVKARSSSDLVFN